MFDYHYLNDFYVDPRLTITVGKNILHYFEKFAITIDLHRIFSIEIKLLLLFFTVGILSCLIW